MRWVLAGSVLLLAGCRHAPTAGSAVGFPEGLARQFPAAARAEHAFAWPDREAFERTWGERSGPDRIEVLRRGRLRWPAAEEYSVRDGLETFERSLCDAIAADVTLREWDGGRILRGVAGADAARWRVVRRVRPGGREGFVLEHQGHWALFEVGETEVKRHPRAAGTPDWAWADWVYVTTLIESDGPVYLGDPRDFDDMNPRVEDGWRYVLTSSNRGSKRTGFRGLLPLVTASWDERWEEGLELARATRDTQLQLEIHKRYQPYGRCSVDTRPIDTAIAYGELCRTLGMTGCFLNLQVRVMANRFDRVIYSSYGEAAQHTHAERLIETGLDIDRFFRGLVLQYPEVRMRDPEMGTYRLARSILEAGRADALEADLARMATSRELGADNRQRAAKTLKCLLELQGRSAEEVENVFDALGLLAPDETEAF